eukprot:10487408-Lingulodinium_polyedra.AAC.1
MLEAYGVSGHLVARHSEAPAFTTTRVEGHGQTGIAAARARPKIPPAGTRWAVAHAPFPRSLAERVKRTGL